MAWVMRYDKTQDHSDWLFTSYYENIPIDKGVGICNHPNTRDHMIKEGFRDITEEVEKADTKEIEIEEVFTKEVEIKETFTYEREVETPEIKTPRLENGKRILEVNKNYECMCGCGRYIRIKKPHSKTGVPNYLPGHYNKAKARK